MDGRNLFAIGLFSVAVDALAHDADQTQFAGNLIGHQFTADKNDRLVRRIQVFDEIQKLKTFF